MLQTINWTVTLLFKLYNNTHIYIRVAQKSCFLIQFFPDFHVNLKAFCRHEISTAYVNCIL